MRFRTLNRLYARLSGYFWLPCTLCGQMSGGHEWRDIDGNPSAIPNPGGEGGSFMGICPDCTRAGLGSVPVGM